MKNGIWMVLLSAGAMSLAACGGDANGGDTADTAAAEAMAETNPCAANPCAANPCAANPCAANPCAANPCAGMSQEMPEGVTMAMVDEGKTVFEGAGICASCHGPSGGGIPNLGSNLTDADWQHSDGSYEAIVETVMNGVTAEASTSGVPMPARGGTNITDEQVRAAAAYVWTLSK